MRASKKGRHMQYINHPEFRRLENTETARVHHHAGFLEAHAAEVASLVLEAARRYTDNALERAVVVFAGTAAKRNAAFMKALASGVVKLASGKPAHQLGRRGMFTLLVLSKVVVDTLDPDTAKRALSKLIEVQVALVDALVSLQMPWRCFACTCMKCAYALALSTITAVRCGKTPCLLGKLSFVTYKQTAANSLGSFNCATECKPMNIALNVQVISPVLQSEARNKQAATVMLSMLKVRAALMKGVLQRN
eukprot:scaffold198710_cov18-Tisochrysis_lutea.AAC.1